MWKRTTQNERRTHNTKHTNKVQTLCDVRFRFFQTRLIIFWLLYFHPIGDNLSRCFFLFCCVCVGCCVYFFVSPSLTLGKISHPTHNTRLRCSYIQNRFALYFVLVAFFVSLYLAKFARVFAFPFVSVSVRFPYCYANTLCALSSVFPCSFRVSPLGVGGLRSLFPCCGGFLRLGWLAPAEL